MREQSEILFKTFITSSGVTIDNRTIAGGEIFFGLKGEHSNGGEFAQAALEKGAKLCVVEDINYKVNDQFMVVENALVALQNLAHAYRNTFGFPLLAITGSNGKTTTKELLRAVLGKKFNVFATKGNFTPFLAAWTPNFIFGILAFYLYRKAPK